MKKPYFPTIEKIKEAKDKVEHLLAIKQINMTKNFPAKEGLTDCIRILNDRIENPQNDFFLPETPEEWEKLNDIYRDQLKGIEKLKTQAGRGIALTCVDYLNGKNGPLFLDAPIKMR